VGGFSVEIYTNQDYSTRDIDFVANDINDVFAVLTEIGFNKEGRHLSHNFLNLPCLMFYQTTTNKYDPKTVP
jgi:hypothetical protein